MILIHFAVLIVEHGKLIFMSYIPFLLIAYKSSNMYLQTYIFKHKTNSYVVLCKYKPLVALYLIFEPFRNSPF